MKRLNLLEKLKNERAKANEEKLLESVKSFLEQLQDEDDSIKKQVLEDSNSDDSVNNFVFDNLDSNRIYHISQIEQVCVNYRLRFLNSNLFKGDLPQEAIQEIKRLNTEHDTELKGFKIMAPSKLFKLENADDPVLMAPMGNNYYYFIHKWGNDLHPLRRFLVWPVKTLENFIFSMFIISLVTTALVPKGIFIDEQSGTEFFLLFIFMFKWLLGMALYYGFAKGKNFNTAIWQSKYYNA
ncbi:hypothetical protein [Mesohalobacter halotolerans]|jgi:hypothetical protein|uniref:Uncharacterized protein n=1 Tax=Mesohalobacter halotolerans TaxID=1883405 RepID=A0A4U5TSX8_9FLAO|nr:hypothetical protein [Mesohalobacter halotolerans]MBS3739287.1 hypothetical protein [Psychroflexus sp.]NBC56673.1 hypothetical protein [Bacteroidota bacterium]TKS57286.1 hypothetical protein FCN74_02380 [Mesohalobacter halotolerans]